MKPNNFFYVKCPDENRFFRSWVEFQTPYHHLTPREKDVAARILQQYFKLKSSMPDDSDPDVLIELLWSRNSRKDMIASLEMTQPHFQMTLGKLRESGFLEGDKIGAKYLPSMIPGGKLLVLQVMFDWSSSSNPQPNAQPA